MRRRRRRMDERTRGRGREAVCWAQERGERRSANWRAEEEEDEEVVVVGGQVVTEVSRREVLGHGPDG